MSGAPMPGTCTYFARTVCVGGAWRCLRVDECTKRDCGALYAPTAPTGNVPPTSLPWGFLAVVSSVASLLPSPADVSGGSASTWDGEAATASDTRPPLRAPKASAPRPPSGTFILRATTLRPAPRRGVGCGFRDLASSAAAVAARTPMGDGTIALRRLASDGDKACDRAVSTSGRAAAVLLVSCGCAVVVPDL